MRNQEVRRGACAEIEQRQESRRASPAPSLAEVLKRAGPALHLDNTMELSPLMVKTQVSQAWGCESRNGVPDPCLMHHLGELALTSNWAVQ